MPCLHFLGLFPAIAPPARHEVVCVYFEDDTGVAWAIASKTTGGRVLDNDGAPLAGLQKERLGVRPEWREAAKRLPKDCGCSDEVHLGPCWLHDDFNRREDNAERLKPPRGSYAAFVLEESLRARELGANMRRLGIENLTTYIMGS